jgi:C-terminal processing protease CtpA/Prc
MPSLSTLRGFAALAILAASFAAHAAQGRLGFAVAVETDGMFGSTLKSVKITKVTAGAPAEQAGLQVGDDVESVDDVPVAGTGGSKIMDIVHAVKPGDHLRLKVRRNASEKLIDIVGGAAD